MGVSEAKKPRELERENSDLKRILAEQALDISMLKDLNVKSRCTRPTKHQRNGFASTTTSNPISHLKGRRPSSSSNKRAREGSSLRFRRNPHPNGGATSLGLANRILKETLP